MKIVFHTVCRAGLALLMVGLLHFNWVLAFMHTLEVEQTHHVCEQQTIHFHESCMDCELFDCLLPLTYTLVSSYSSSSKIDLKTTTDQGFTPLDVYIRNSNKNINGLRAPPVAA